MYIPSNQNHISSGLYSSIKNVIKKFIIKILKIFHYDINSLYPTGMKYCYFPVGKITHFIPRNKEALNLLGKEHKLGIYRVNVKCPNDLLHPILPIKIEHNCVYPTGTWTGWYHSE